MVKNILNTAKNFWANSIFQGKCKLLKNCKRWKIFRCIVFSAYSLGDGQGNLTEHSYNTVRGTITVYEYDTIRIGTLAHAFRMRVSFPDVQYSA